MKRKCSYCKQRFESALMIIREPMAWCSEDHQVQWSIKAGRKLREAQHKAHRREKREAKAKVRERLKTLSDWVSEAQTWVNRVVVAEDRSKGCISCDSPLVTECGHYFHRGSKYRVARLTLDRRNLNGQCGHCNRWKGGMQHEYRLGFIARYGQEAFDGLCELKRQTDRGEIAPLTVDECKAVIAEMKQRHKELRQNIGQTWN
jgi:hypothetical protein